jgi:hypothetical protein
VSDLILDANRLAGALRVAWLNRRQVRVTLTERCVIRTIVGRVSSVSVTGSFALVDGWHVPVGEVVGVGKPTLGDLESYAHGMHVLRLESGDDHDAR